MQHLLCKTRGNAPHHGKPRVYFTAHPADRPKYLETVREDLLGAFDCAVYYAQDADGGIEEEYLDTDLSSMNLIVVPVTYNLLSEPCRAMQTELAYAKEHGIPILPLMMESGLESLYSRPECFGGRQYLSPFSTEPSEIGYREKLDRYLKSVLTDDETAKRVRAAFDAYVFLSYRKKDRHLANALMREIHKKPKYRDIAIWYDEYLPLGEDFRENILEALSRSQLFALLVTPSLLEEPNGEPNFIMGVEYPHAKETGMQILAAEMVETDHEILQSKFPGLPNCAAPKDEEVFQKQLRLILKDIANDDNDTDPDHLYLIGLAYLNGIDVEIDHERGASMIRTAAESGHLDAMQKLFHMYDNGVGVPLDYQEAARWEEKILEYHQKNFGQRHINTRATLNNLACTYGKLGDRKKAFELIKKAYPLCCESLVENDPNTLTVLNNLALNCGEVGDHEKALELKIKVYALRCKILGKTHPDTLTTLNNIAYTYGKLGDHEKALALGILTYHMFCAELGENHPNTLITLSNLAYTYGELGDHQKALELEEKAYASRCKVLGVEHPDTLQSLSHLAYTHGELGDHQKALELEEKAYALRCNVLKETHPDTLTTLGKLAYTYRKLGDHKRALELEKKVYASRCKVLGEAHTDTLTTLHNLAYTYGELGDHQKALELEEKAYLLYCKTLGEKHINTLKTLNNLAITNFYLGRYKQALESAEKFYLLCCTHLGAEHPMTVKAKDTLDDIRKHL